MPRPTPRVPPVTTTARPVKSNGCRPVSTTATSSNWLVKLPTSGALAYPRAATGPKFEDPITGVVRAVMGIKRATRAPGTAEVVIDVPPVNALDVASWFALADAVTASGSDPDVRVVVLRAEGRGFCAGVDIKEIQAKGDEALVGVNRGCAAAFAAVYDCEVPVIAAVHGFCLGGGIGLAGNADIVVASEDATFGLPEVDRGALGAATHLARLVPQHKVRQMVYSALPATAHEVAAYGSLAAVVPGAQLVDTAYELASQIASKSPSIIRRAKESLNGIDPVDVKRSYRFEQGFTYELHVRGVADEQRQAFVDKRQADTSR